MPDYDAWNRALIAYFVEGATPGAPVFLTADDDTLALVGERLGAEGAAAPTAADPVQDFERAVRARVVGPDGRVALAAVAGSGVHDEPRCAAFLCTLVLAASRMRDTDDVDGVNYFTHLRTILGLDDRGGRPPGMEGGAEEPLWRDWNFWLQVHGYLPTATAGDDGPQRYIHYARCQALLREMDKDKLRELFQARGWRAELDADTLLLRVRREAPMLTAQLRELLASDSQRLELLADAVHELYEAWRVDPVGSLGHRGRGRTLYAGLYREEDPLAGTVCYQLYPRLTRGGAGELRVRIGDGVETLRPEQGHARRYYPLGVVDGATLTAGAHYPIEQPADLRELVLPAQEYWVLVPDPDMPDSGVYATWGRPRLNEPFILLCRERLLGQFKYLVDERLIDSPGEPVPVLDGDWHELRDCYVVSEAWPAAHFSHPELCDALRPTDRCNVILSGGLRLPGRPAWLEGAGPNVTVSGFAPEAELTVIRTDGQTEQRVVERTQRTGEPVQVDWPGPGVYQIVGCCGGQEAPPRAVTIGAWDDLRLSVPAEEAWVALGAHRLCGAALD
jgi:hypothetical protein